MDRSLSNRQTTIAYVPVVIPINNLYTFTPPICDKEIQTEKVQQQVEYEEFKDEIEEINRILNVIIEENCVCFLNDQFDFDPYCICRRVRSEIVNEYSSDIFSRCSHVTYSLLYKLLNKI